MAARPSAGSDAVVAPARYLGARVLVVDDQAMNREIAGELMSSVGIAVQTAENGQLALDILTAAGPTAFDLVLMDIQMPVMDGLSATRELRARPEFKALPIIAMTAHTMEHEKAISAGAGLNDHIGKPFEAARFYGILAKWISTAKQQPMPETGCPGGSAPARFDLGATLGALIDVAAGLARFNGNEERYRHWLGDFVASAADIPQQIRSDVAAGETASASKKLHAFKGRVGMLGMTDLHAAVSKWELALRGGLLEDRQISELEVSIRHVQGELQRVLAAHRGS